MLDALKSTSYWATVLSIGILKWLCPETEVAHLLVSCVAASYFIGRGIAQYPKMPTTGWIMPEFSVLLLSLGVLAWPPFVKQGATFIALVILVIGYNIGRGLCNHYRSKVQMVINR